jgi:hypothetical protein
LGRADRSSDGRAYFVYVFVHFSASFIYSRHFRDGFLLCVLRAHVNCQKYCHNYLYYVGIAGVTLDAGLLARSQYPEGPATGHLDTGFSWFPCVYKQMLRWLLCFQVATTCFSCSPPDLKLNVSVASFICLLRVK